MTEPESDRVANPNSRQLLILQLLNRGHPDEVVARAAEVSVRTVRREIAELICLYSVSSRFQLGVIASELGVVSSHTSIRRSR